MRPLRKPLEIGQFLKHQESYLREHKSYCCFCTIFKCNNFLQSTFDYPKILQLHVKFSHISWKQTFQTLAFPNNYSSIFIIYLVKNYELNVACICIYCMKLFLNYTHSSNSSVIRYLVKAMFHYKY
ncbi:hypothetical protein ACJW30_03G052200 [Castanea mollissima]